MLLKHLLDEGLSKTAIAQRLGVSRRAVYHWIATGQLERDLEAPPRRTAAPRATKLDAYHGIITTRLETYPELSAVRLFEEVRRAGYTGGITQVRDHVARVRPRPEPEPVVRFETPPGHQAQVDFAEFRFPWGKRYALLVVLGYSRLLWLKFYPRQSLATVISGLEEAFAYFGGVPHELCFAQMKAVILEDHRHEGGKLLENAEFLRFTRHWGFRIRACRPYRAKTKGKVGRWGTSGATSCTDASSWGDADLDAQPLTWLDEVANRRVHRMIQAVPQERFEGEERTHLLPLAEQSYRPLVLPPERTARRTMLHVLPAVASITVEQRGLAAYQSLIEEVS